MINQLESFVGFPLSPKDDAIRDLFRNKEFPNYIIYGLISVPGVKNTFVRIYVDISGKEYVGLFQQLPTNLTQDRMDCYNGRLNLAFKYMKKFKKYYNFSQSQFPIMLHTIIVDGDPTPNVRIDNSKESKCIL